MQPQMNVNGAAVRTHRESRSWSQEHLAKASGLSVRTVQRVEAEGVGSAETRLALAAALNVPVSELQFLPPNAQAIASPPVAGSTVRRWLGSMFNPTLNLAVLVQTVGVVVVLWYGLVPLFGPSGVLGFRVLEALLGIAMILAGGVLYRYALRRRRQHASQPSPAA
jgi:transcriptional regulator with XRE-family HTH domain